MKSCYSCQYMRCKIPVVDVDGNPLHRRIEWRRATARCVLDMFVGAQDTFNVGTKMQGGETIHYTKWLRADDCAMYKEDADV